MRTPPRFNQRVANTIGCAPSQINYVLSSRFTPEHYMIKPTRRRGYIRIRRVVMAIPLRSCTL
ncbi:MAG: CtsR family transcriptional regulator [Oscillospiraceae bacterium]